MNSGSFRYLVKQGISNVWLNRLMSLASIGILTACFIIVGCAALLSVNIRDMFVAIESQNEMVVYISDDASEQTVQQLGEQLGALEGISDVTYVSKDDALEEQKGYMGSAGNLLEGLENDNPLPASYRVVLLDLSQLDAIYSQCIGLSGVDSISAPTNVAETLTGIERAIIIIGGVIISILLLTSLVVIGNTIRLTVFARRREINIMKYVGATNRFIRLPFISEGITIGIFAAIVAFGAITLLYNSLSKLFTESVISWVSVNSNFVPFSQLWYWLLGGFLVSGILIGAIGSSSSVRKHLKV